jgi:hypothetical protein
MVVCDHAGEELLSEVVVAKCVDFKGEVDVLFRRVQDGFAARDAGIVDQDRWVTESRADGRSGGGDRIWGGEIAFEEAYG